MANKRITELTDIETPASNDVLEIVDVSDTTDSPEGTSKKVLVSALGGGGGTTPTLQQVTTAGATTDKDVKYQLSENTFIIIKSTTQEVEFYENVSGSPVLRSKMDKGSFNVYRNGGGFTLMDGNSVYIEDATAENSIGLFLDTGTGVTTLALVSPDGDTGYFIDKIRKDSIEYDLPNGEESQIDKLSIIVNANKTAENDAKYTVIANATFTDPTPAEGKGYIVFVRNGTATIGGVGYTAGSYVFRFYHSGAWSSTNIAGGSVPNASPTVLGIAKLYENLLASNTDGSVNQSVLVSEFSLKDVLPVIYEKHANVPAFGLASLNNLEGVAFIIAGGTSRSFSDTNIYTRRQRLGLTVSTTGNLAQARQSSTYFNRNSNLDVIIGLGFAENCDESLVRVFSGVSANTGVFSNVEPTALLNCIGMAKLTTSNNLHLIHNDGSGTATEIDLGSDFPSNTVSIDFYTLRLKTNGSNIDYCVTRVNTNNIAIGTISTDLPATTQALNLGYYVVQSSGANTTTGIDFFGSNIIKQ